MLVLEDQGSSVHAATVAAVEHALAQRGFAVVGAEAEISERDIRLMAGARHAVGLGNAADDEAVLRLQSFLDEEQALAAILWLAQSEDDDGPFYRVLVRSELSVEPPHRFEPSSRSGGRP